MSLLPPNPSLVAIILLIRTEHGTKHVYHYPPHPGQDHPPISSRNDGDNGNHSSDSGAGGAAYSTSGESSCSSVENGYGPNSDDDTRGRVNKEKSHVKESGDIDESGSTSPEKGSNTGWVAMKGNKELLGLPSGFSEFLCPPTEMDRRRFEMGIGQLTFLGWPCFAKKDGSWKSKRKQRRTSSKDKTDGKSGSAFGSDKKMKVIDETVEETDSALDSGLVTHDELSEVEPSTTVNDEPTQSPRNDYKQDTAEVKQQDSKNTEPYQPGISIQSGETLTMFHVVFVMNPPPMEYQIRVDEMYSHVVKHFSKALKREQARSNYVLRECQLLKSMKARHDPASREILRSSSLAKAICTLFKAISNSRIAHIDLTPKVSFWVQIPTPTSISSLPDATEPQIPGIWLTTATAIPTHDELLTTGHKLASHFGLLLLTDIQSILASVSLNSRIRPVLEQYLNHTIPTKSFLQISQKAKVALDDVTIMASHLIHWRQARIIPPLHKKDTYIVSPNADMRRLRSSALQFQRDFPLQPSLNTILSRLNSANRPYKAIIPNKDHQEAYMSILAWLMRYGWVTQIRTFGWVRVPGHVRQAVEDEIQRETHRIQHEDEWNKKTATKSINFNTSNRNDERSLVGIEDPTNDERHLTVSPGLLAPSIMSSESSESRASMSSTLTAVPIFGQPHSSSILGQTPRSALLISSPTEASGVQRRYLEYVSSTIGRTGGPEVRDAWNRCLPFFDGQHALEQIPAREGWKRSWMEGLRAGWIKDGWLREGKSW